MVLLCPFSETVIVPHPKSEAIQNIALPVLLLPPPLPPPFPVPVLVAESVSFSHPKKNNEIKRQKIKRRVCCKRECLIAVFALDFKDGFHAGAASLIDMQIALRRKKITYLLLGIFCEGRIEFDVFPAARLLPRLGFEASGFC